MFVNKIFLHYALWGHTNTHACMKQKREHQISFIFRHFVCKYNFAHCLSEYWLAFQCNSLINTKKFQCYNSYQSKKRKQQNQKQQKKWLYKWNQPDYFSFSWTKVLVIVVLCFSYKFLSFFCTLFDSSEYQTRSI